MSPEEQAEDNELLQAILESSWNIFPEIGSYVPAPSICRHWYSWQFPPCKINHAPSRLKT